MVVAWVCLYMLFLVLIVFSWDWLIVLIIIFDFYLCCNFDLVICLLWLWLLFDCVFVLLKCMLLGADLIVIASSVVF